MSVSSSTDTYYCDPDDVARFFEHYDEFLDEETDGSGNVTQEATSPSRSDVMESIKEWSAYIDRETRHGWRANRVEDETHDQKHLYYWLTGHPLNLMKRDLRPLDPEQGDKLEVWTGNQWEDWLTEGSYTQGRDGDYWLDAPVGQLWVYERAFISPHPKFRITYRYGRDHVPEDIKKACAKYVAQDLVHGDFYGTMVPGNNSAGNSDPSETARMWYQQAENAIDNYRELSWI